MVVLALSACNRAPADREAVRKGLMEHLSKNAGLDMSAVDLEIKDLRFEGNEAKAEVAFKPKSTPDQGMSMNYTLERRGQDWVVKGRASGHGGAAGGMAPQQPSANPLPPGHPPAGSDTKAGDLPPGHPPVNAPPAPAK